MRIGWCGCIGGRRRIGGRVLIGWRRAFSTSTCGIRRLWDGGSRILAPPPLQFFDFVFVREREGEKHRDWDEFSVVGVVEQRIHVWLACVRGRGRAVRVRTVVVRKGGGGYFEFRRFGILPNSEARSSNLLFESRFCGRGAVRGGQKRENMWLKSETRRARARDARAQSVQKVAIDEVTQSRHCTQRGRAIGTPGLRTHMQSHTHAAIAHPSSDRCNRSGLSSALH